MGSALLLLVAAALAGVASLASEVLWMRGLGRGVGVTYEGVATVAGLFLAGLGAGALWAARGAPRVERPARRAALLLAAAGTLAALSPLYLATVPALHDALPDLLGGSVATVLAALPLVVPAAALLGAAFPALVRARAAREAHAGARTGAVYAANTLGAVVGVVGVPFALHGLGETMALRLAGAAALAASLLLLLLDAPSGEAEPETAAEHVEPPPAAPAPAPAPPWPRRLDAALFVSGAAALVAQLAWLRMLQPLAGAHLPGLVLLLAPLLLALAAGAAAAGPLADRARLPARLLPWLFAGAGTLTLLSVPLAGTAPLRLATSEHPVTALVLSFLLAVGPAAAAFGALLPAAVRAGAAGRGGPAGPAGRLFGWNALGALAGSLLAGFLLLPTLGAERSLLVAGALPLLTAVALGLAGGGRARLAVAGGCALPLVALVVPGAMAAWLGTAPGTLEALAALRAPPPHLRLADRDDLDLYATWFAGRRAAPPGATGDVVQPVFEGRCGRVVLVEEPDGRIGLRRDGLRESLFDPDQPQRPALTEWALGLLPCLVHPSAHRALVIGHGAGWSAEAVLAAGLEDVDVAEIDDAVLAAARAARGLQRLPAEADPRAHLRAVDGRVLLRRAAGGGPRYDVIVSQPSHPWHPGSAHLFTREAYEVARDALADEGVLAQWLNLFDMTPDLLRSALATFRAAFPQAWLFAFGDEVVLLGFRAPPQVRPERWEAFFAPPAAGAANRRGPGLEHPGDLFKHLLLDARGLAQVAPDGTQLLVDDRPRLALELAWRRLQRVPRDDVLALLEAAFPPAMETLLPDAALRERWTRDAARGWLRSDAERPLRLWTRRLRWGASPEGALTLAEAALAGGDGQRALTLLEAARERFPQRADLAAAWIRTSTALLGRLPAKTAQEHLAACELLVERMPADSEVLAAAGLMERSMGRVRPALEYFARASALPDAAPGVRLQNARVILSEAFTPEDALQARRLLEADPATYDNVDALDMLLRMVGAAGEEDRARELSNHLSGLQRTRGLALLRAAGGLLARGDAEGARREAEACSTVWPSRGEPFELLGLATLAAIASQAAHHGQTTATEQDALDAFAVSCKRSRDADAARARARRILGWYGRDPSRLDTAQVGEDGE